MQEYHSDIRHQVLPIPLTGPRKDKVHKSRRIIVIRYAEVRPQAGYRIDPTTFDIAYISNKTGSDKPCGDPKLAAGTVCN